MFLMLLVAGCGYKGPLYLPKDKPASAKPASVVLPPATPATTP